MSEPDILPVAKMLEFTCNPPSVLTDAVTLPSAILFNSKPVTALAGIDVNPEPSPINEPVNVDDVTAVVLIVVPVKLLMVTPDITLPSMLPVKSIPRLPD